MTFLKTLSPFQNWGPLPISLILHHIHEVHYRPRQAVYREGTMDSNLYFVREGEICLKKTYASNRSQHTLISLTTGSYFGEQELIANEGAIKAVR
jgi:CRP-like cAMP-binding protein